MNSNILTRRDFLKAMGIAAFGLACTPLRGATDSPPGHPNVLFIAVDDLNDWTGCLGGHPDVKTPNLDRLADQGVLFTRAYCAAPSCNPSRAAVLTGLRPSTSGVYHNNQPWRNSALLKEAITLPQHFTAHGYQAMGSGKIFHGSFPDPDSWELYWPDKTRTMPEDPRPEERPLNGFKNTKHFDWGPLDMDKKWMGDWQVADWIVQQLEKTHEKPFFLACGFYRPHLPWYVPKAYFDLYPLHKITLPVIKEDDLDDLPPMGRQMAKPQKDHARVIEHDQWRQAVQGYLACISFMDECLGKVMHALNKSRYRNNTIVVLWSDHGWHLGEKLHWRKFALWEEATRNVLLFRAPGVTAPRGRCTRPVSLLDIYPTLIELCGLSPKKELEGESLVYLLKDPEAQRKRPVLTTHGRNNHSVRNERWRFIRYKDGTEELYDHEKDELEWTNLADRPEHAEIRNTLAQWLPRVNAESIPSKKEENQ